MATTHNELLDNDKFSDVKIILVFENFKMDQGDLDWNQVFLWNIRISWDQKDKKNVFKDLATMKLLLTQVQIQILPWTIQFIFGNRLMLRVGQQRCFDSLERENWRWSEHTDGPL